MKKLNSTVRMLVLVGVLVISALALMSNTRASGPTGSLTSLDAGDISAYRWEAMGRFYDDLAAPADGLKSLDADDISAYRWEAMGRFYLDHAAPDLTPYHLSERGSIVQPVDLAAYFQSERAAYSGDIAMAIYHASEWSW